MGMTMAEKVLARASNRDKVVPGQIVTAAVDWTWIAGDLWQVFYPILKELKADRFWDPDRIIVVHEHMVPPSSLEIANALALSRKVVQEYGITRFYEMGRSGICHQLFIEEGYALPGQLVVGTDSHTCSYGALNTASRGIQIDIINVLLKGELWFRVPETIRVEVTGKLEAPIMSKDVILHLAGLYGTEMALYKSIEFVGETVDQMSIASRIAVANMGIEVGAKFLMMEADQKTEAYLEGRAKEPYRPVKSDQDANFEHVIYLDVDQLEPMVACPHDVGNVKPISQVKGIKMDQAFLGSCTNARYEDLEIAAKILKDRKIHPDIRMIVTPASQEVYKEALKNGLIEIFAEAEAVVTNPTCGACGGIHLGLLGDGEKCIGSQNRNFKGRMGSPNAEVYIASPATVAASALAGALADPRDYFN